MKKIIDNKDEKVKLTLKGLGESFTLSVFISKFAELNPDDYKRLEERFVQDEKSTRNLDWKKNTMPTPEKYLGKAIKDYAKRNPDKIKILKGDKFKKVP